jgi:hypothetical protein
MIDFLTTSPGLDLVSVVVTLGVVALVLTVLDRRARRQGGK